MDTFENTRGGESGAEAERPSQSVERREKLAEMLRDIDDRHGRKTERGIDEYAEAFDASQDELLHGNVLNIGDPLARLPADFENVVSLDYFYGSDARDEIERLEALGETRELSEREQQTLALFRSWQTRASSRVRDGAQAVKGVFPLLPFRDEAFDRVLSLNAISMHPFDELGGFTDDEWKLWWDELLRVLRPGGKAYIGPFDRLSEHETYLMTRKLEEMRDDGELDFVLGDYDGALPDNGPGYVAITKPRSE